MTTVDLVVSGLAEGDLTIREALDRAGTLKSELVEYGMSRRWARELDTASEETFGRHDDPDENQWIAFLDHFLLQRRLPDGRTVLQRFVASRGDLPRAEREMLLGWGDVVEGVFEVEDRIGDLLLTTNVIDELAYTIGATAGPTSFDQVPVPGIMATRVVRVGPVWAVSGATAAFDLTQRQTIYPAAAELAMRKPELCFRNPAKLLLAREFEQVHRSVFLEHFGADLVVLAGAEFEQRMSDYWQACQSRVRSAVSADGEVTEPARIADDYGLAESETVGVIYDEILMLLGTVLGRQLELLQLGETVAVGVGGSVREARLLLIVVGAGLAAISVAAAGTVGFVAFIAPHIARGLARFTGNGILPLSAAVGAALVVIADYAGQRVFEPIELPVGILTSLLGGPYFLYLLLRSAKAYAL